MDNFKYKKKYGQNFLKNINTVKKIVSVADIKDNSLIIEVGPGKGILTKELSKSAKNVICYEIDTELKEYLDATFNDSNVDIIYDDFLNRNIEKDIAKYDYDNLYFISNVPYYITTPILMKLINPSLYIKKTVIMVQKEVGERFSALVGTKDYSSITVFLNYYFNIKKEFIVKKEQFVPAPNVDSVIISFSRKEKLLSLNDKELFFQLVRDSFQFKRKTIRNNLKKYDLNKLEKVLNSNGFDLSTRAEQIPIDVFVEMSNSIS